MSAAASRVAPTLALASATAIPWQRRAWIRAGAIVAGLAVVETVVVWAFLGPYPTRAALWFWAGVAEFLLWAALAPAIVALARRFPVDLRGGGWRTIWLHLALSLAVGTAACGARVAGSLMLTLEELELLFPGGRAVFFARQLVSFLMVEATIYWCIVALTQWWGSEARRYRAEAGAAQARMLAVQQSLAPHFTLNALNALVSMQQEDSREQRFTIAIGGFMHDLLAARHRTTHSLRDECELVGRYLRIERERLGARLDVQVEIDPEVEPLEVPVLLLQPLLENAVRHAVAPFPAGGSIRLSAWRDGRESIVRIDSEATGAFRDSAGAGYGEESARSRLHLLYGRRCWFRSSRLAPERYQVTMAVTADAATGGDVQRIDRRR